MMWQKYRFYILLALAAVLSWWLLSLSEREDEAKATVVMKNAADFFSHDYSKIEMDEFGLPKSDLVAETMMHMSGDGSIHLQKPVMTLFNKNAPPWVLQSESAIMAANGEDLQMNGKVFINREGGQDVSPLTINTSALRVRLPDNYAETNQWAEIISPPNRTVGVGMQVTFVEPIHLKLLAKVKGRYELN